MKTDKSAPNISESEVELALFSHGRSHMHVIHAALDNYGLREAHTLCLTSGAAALCRRGPDVGHPHLAAQLVVSAHAG